MFVKCGLHYTQNESRQGPIGHDRQGPIGHDRQGPFSDFGG
jgi:hypothetical protein